MPAYVVAMMHITDPDQYRSYTDRTPALVKRHGGKFLTRGEPFDCVEGTPYDGRMVLLEFPSKAHVTAWYADPEYEAAMVFRHAASTMQHLLVQEGSAPTDAPDPKL